MKKSLIALLLTLALVVTVSVFAVSAAETKTTAEILAADYSLETGVCPHCDTLWSELNPVEYTGQTATGHYVMNADYTKTISTVKNTEVVIHMNGKKMTGGGSRAITHYTSGKLYIVDAKNGGGKITGATAANTSSTGGVIRVDGAADNKLYLYNIEVVGAPSWKQGGAIWLNGKSEFYMYGGKVSGGSAVDRGGNICLLGNAKATIAGTVSGGSVNGGINCGGNIYVETGCTLTLEDGAYISGGTVNTAGSYGGGNIGIRGSGQMIMNGGTVTGGNHKGKGGNIFKENAGKVTLNGGTITAGISGSGANVYAIGDTEAKRPTVEVKGVTISDGNASSGTCGGVYISGYATLTMTSGSITGGQSKYGGGNIRTNGANCVVNISGGTISGGTVTAGDGGNLFSNTDATINITGGEFTNGDVMGVGANIALTKASATSKIEGATFTGGTAKGNVTADVVQGGSVYLAAPITTIKDCAFNGGTINNSAYTSNNANTTYGGALYSSKVTLIDGCTFTGGSAAYGGTVYVTTNATIQDCTFGDEANTKNSGTASSNGGTIYVPAGKTVTMKNCTVYGGQAHRGGVAYVDKGATLHVYGCSVKNAKAGLLGGNFAAIGGTINIVNSTVAGGQYASTSSAIKGGNIYVESKVETDVTTPGTVVVKNDTALSGSDVASVISGGKTLDSYGGNIYIENGATVTLENGTTVTDGTALRSQGKTSAGQGGNISVQNGTLNINGATISNTTGAANANHGGNIYLHAANSALHMTAGTISGGQAISYGGNIYAFTNSTVDVTGGTISGGNANQGANLYIRQTNKVTLKDCQITGGTGAGSAYSIHINDAAAGATLDGATVSGSTVGAIQNYGILILNGATISGNSKPTAPGIYNRTGATVTMTGGSISGNTASTASYSATAAGGNVYNDGTFTMVSGTIENGTVQNSYKRASGEDAKPLAKGGNIYNAGIFNMQNGTISGGQAKRSGTGDNQGQGGNIYNTGAFNMTDGTITEGFAVTNGGNVFLSGTADAQATFTMQKGTISNGNAAGNQGGVRVADYATFTMEAGLLDNNTSTYSGGNIGVQGTNAILDINGGTISNGKATSTGSVKASAGNILVSTGGTATIDDAIISGGTSTANGGNMVIEGTGTATVNNTKILNGHSVGNGGNIYIGNTGTTCSFTGCEILGGVAGTKVTEGEGEEETIVAPTTDGRGGNIAISVNTILTNCVIRNGESWSYYNPGGGNIYYVGGDNQIMNGCTVTGGQSYGAGGNICLHGSPVVIIKGDSYIQGGISHMNWGGNIGMTHGNADAATAGTLKLEGDATVDGTDSRCHKNAQYGNNIGIDHKNAKVYIYDNATVKNGDNAFESVDNFKRFSIAVIDTAGTAPKVYVGGNAQVDKIYLRGTDTDSDGVVDTIPEAQVSVEAGFTGNANVYTQVKAVNDLVKPGATVYGQVVSNGYEGTGALKVLNHGQSGYVVIVEDGVMKICSITGFKLEDPDGIPDSGDEFEVENGFASLDAVVDARYAYAKLYVGGDYELSEKTDGFPIDLNNNRVHIKTNGYKLAPIDWRTDSLHDEDATNATVTGGARYTYLTVDNDENVLRVTRNPINGYQYLNVKGTHDVDTKGQIDMKTPTGATTEKTFWTSNRVRVELYQVSLKTTKGGIYFKTKVRANANAAPYLVDYGTAVSLVEDVEIGPDFLEEDQLANNGVMWTNFDLNETGVVKFETNSALVKNIVAEEHKNGKSNDDCANMKITATSFVTAMIEGANGKKQEVKFMADETKVLTFKDVMMKLDDAVLEWSEDEENAAKIPTAVAFYDKWNTLDSNLFANWVDEENNPLLKNLKAASDAAKIA